MRRYSVFLWVLLVVSIFLVSNASAYEYGVTDTNTITFVDGGVGIGGAFNWKADNGYTWSSFCIEKNEIIHQGDSYLIGSITDRAIKGGSGVETHLYADALDGVLDQYDPISNATAWLFWNFSRDDLEHYTGTDGNQLELQNLIWWLEDENRDTMPVDKFTMNQNLWMGTFMDSGWENEGQVRVLNIGYYDYNNDGVWKNSQSQLIAAAPVPEPATMVLLGIGLLFIAGVSRKKLKP